MNAIRNRNPKVLWGAALTACFAVLGTTPARAQTVDASLTESFISGVGNGSFGTVTVSSVVSNPDEVLVSLTLAPGEVFAFGGAGESLLFDISGNPTITSFQMVSAPGNQTFSFSQAPPVIMADGTGSWNDAVTCSACKGTSMMVSGTLSFTLTASSAISPASFVANADGLYFGSDIGVPNGSGGFSTGVVAATSVSVVPEASTYALMATGLSALGPFVRRRRH